MLVPPYDPQVSGPRLETERLILRRWRPEDRAPFAAMNADPRVLRYLSPPLPPDRSDALIDRIESCFEARGYGLWAVEARAESSFVGFAGLSPVDLAVPFAPAVEVGWRLARAHWGHGYATEAATAALAFGFEQRDLQEIVSFTAQINERSRAVMRRLGMRHDPAEDFDHPSLEPADPLRRHVLCRMTRTRWTAARPG
jgi:RimJ/RimL family protein N-acetyltransferase